MKGLLVGYGSIGRRHLTNLHALGVDDWALVRTGMGTLPLEPPCPVRTYSSLADALHAESPTFAVIANPTSLHVPTALACVEQGCDILLEKPVSHTLEGLEALQQSVDRNQVGAVVAFQFRHHPALRRIRRVLADGLVGAPLHASATWGEYLPGWHPWEDMRLSHAARRALGGGVLHIAHPFDSLRMLFGEVTHAGGVFGEPRPLGLEVPESVDVSLRFASPVDAHVHLDYWARPTVNHLEITCTEGSLEWDYLTGELRMWRARDEVWAVEQHPSVDARNDLFVAMARNFLEVVAGRAAPACTLQDGIEEVRIADAIERSASAAPPHLPPWPA